MPSKPISVGFTLLGKGQWRGGLNYQKSLLELIGGPLSACLHATVFVDKTQESLAVETFGSLVNSPKIVCDERANKAGMGARALRAVLFGKDHMFADLILEHNIDVVFENASFYGVRFPRPILVWIPDFQHKYLPQFFTPFARIRREIGFRAQCMGQRSLLLSSNTAREDCERFYPSSIGRTYTARFCGKINIDEIYKRAQIITELYDLPKRFFYLPNHFWAHKNHSLVLKALVTLIDRNQIHLIPPVILSGPTEDDRNPGIFEDFMGQVARNGLSHLIRHLGLIPFHDVLALNMASIAVLNPSRFEGWSSTVEESKSLGSHMILSDLPVHREQAPGADFFSVDDFATLASIMIACTEKSAMRFDMAPDLRKANEMRRGAFATDFLNAVNNTAAKL